MLQRYVIRYDVARYDKMTVKCAPVCITAHICKAIWSVNQKIHCARLQLLVIRLDIVCNKIHQYDRENITEHHSLYYLLSVALMTFLPGTSQ